MRHVIGYVSILALLAIAPAGYAVDLLNVPMGSQVDNGKSTCWYWASTTLTPALNPDSGAIYVPAPYTGGDTQTFMPAGVDPISGLNEPEPFLRHNIATTTGHYFYQAVSFNLADAGAGCESGALDLSAPCARLEFDVRYYKSDGIYSDAPVAAVLQCFGWDAGSSRYIEVGRRTLGPGGWVYGTQYGDAPYPTWTHVVAYVNVDYVDSGRNGGTFNIAQVDGIRFHGTDWTSTGFDFVDFKNLVISDDTIPAPSITPMPNPDSATVRTEYVRQLDGGDGKCDPTMNWTLVAGPSGMEISQTGKLSGWTPSISDSGTSVNITVTATNSAGSDTESWTVQVVGFSELVNISMDNQIDLGQGPAIVAPSGCDFTFEDPADEETTDRFARYHLTSTCGCGGYYGYGNEIHIDLTKAGYAPIAVTGCQTRFKIDLRYYQLAGLYSDAPVFVRFISSNGGVRDYGVIYGPNVPEGERYPIWKHVSMATDDTTAQPYTDSGSFDPGQVVKISFWGTDWSGSPTCQDYVDFNNVIITNVPPAPSLVPVAPDPENVYIGMPYTRQIMLVECTVVDWSLSGLPGATIDENGLINWTPNSLGTYNATVTAANGSGSASDSWTVNVAAIPPTSDGSNVAQPWGTIHGNIYATQSSDDPSLLFDSRWSNSAKVDWAYTATIDGLTGGTERGGISFDESGNLYWKTTEGLLASLVPDKTLRWVGNVAGTPVDLGQGDTTTPVVGDGGETGRVYVLGDSGLYAFQKSDGAQLWAAALPDANFASTGDRLTPVLYDGRVYVVGAGLTMKTVYEIDAATGTIVWAKPIAVNLDTGWGDAKGAMTLVPNALGAGIHGLYFNADGSGDGTDVYCIAINTSTYSGSLQWMADGGKVVRSHVIYSATTGRLYTTTWGDDGKQFYSFSPTTGLLVGNNSPEGSGHGYNDFGALDFNGTDVIATGFGGNVIRYHDTGDGSTTSTFYSTSSNYGEFRMYGGLYKDADGDSIAVMATRSTEGPNARVLAFNATTEPQVTCSSYEDSGVYIDNLKITHGATGVETTRLDVAGFEGYTLGDLPGQANPGGTGTATWEDDTGGGPSAVGMVQVVDSLPAGGSGKGILVDAAGGCGGWQGVFANIGGSLTDTVVVVSWDQYRGDLTDNEWFAEDISWTGWWAMAWDSSTPAGIISPRQYDYDPPVGLTAGVWQHIEYRFDFGAATPTVSVSVDGVSASADLEAAETSIRGWDFEVEGTQKDEQPPTPVAPIFSFDTGTVDMISGLQMGPVVGDAAQHIYYWVGDTLTALTFVKPQPGDFNGDGDVDEDDLDVFQSCATGPGIGGPPAGCSAEDFGKADFNSDEDVDQSDFAGFQRCYSGTDVPGNVDCLGL